MLREAIITRMQATEMSQLGLAKLCHDKPSQGAISMYVRGLTRMNDDNISRVLTAPGGSVVFPGLVKELRDASK